MSDLNMLEELLMKNRRTLYDSNEMNEILLMLYSTLCIAFRLQAHTLVVLPKQILLLDREEKIINKFPQEVYPVERLSDIDMLNLIMSRDETVREHLEVISRNPEEVKYKVKGI